MSIALASIGATSDGTTSLSTDYPASISAGNLLLHFVASKFNDSSHSTPGSFTLLDTETAGVGAEFGSDSGTIVASLFSLIASGSESGSVSTTVTNGNSSQGFIARLTRSGGSGFLLASTTARWVTDNTQTIAVTFDDAIDFAPGDYVAAFVGLNTNSPTGLGSLSFTASGITFGTAAQQRWTSTGTGGDSSVAMVDAIVSSGTGSVVPSFSALKATSAQGEGPVILVRLREASGGGFQAAWARNSNTMIGAAR
jgi:hypothetical protein